MSDYPVVIIGAGLSGLACAKALSDRGIRCHIFEASDEVGGRVRTDIVNGFLLDRGFQVFLTSYPDAPHFLNYETLNLNNFKAGALIRYGNSFSRISDVVRHPADLPGNIFSQAGTTFDKLKIASLRNEVCGHSVAEIETAENITTIQRLENFGFSKRIIDSFFRPFLSGVFLEPELQTSRRMLDFVFKMFSKGEATLPGRGMSAIPNQIADGLPRDTISFNTKVTSISDNRVEFENGISCSAEKIVLATDGHNADRLLGTDHTNDVGVSCLYFAAKSSPVNEPILVLNGNSSEDGPINNLCVPSDVSPAYAPEDSALVSITVLGHNHDDAELQQRVLEQAFRWYGDQVGDWQHLRTYQIDRALPRQHCSDLDSVKKSLKVSDGLFRCGDYVDFASIQGALSSGRKLAETICET